MFVLCTRGEVKALINLNEVQVHANDVITLMPGTIFQINEIIGELKIYFLGFSSSFIEQSGQSHSMLDAIFLTLGRPVITLKPEGTIITLGRPVITLKPEGTIMMEQYLQMVIAMYEKLNEKVRHWITPNLYNDVHTGIATFEKRIALPQLHAIGDTEL